MAEEDVQADYLRSIGAVEVAPRDWHFPDDEPWCAHRMDDPDHPSHGLDWAGKGFTRRDGESTT